MARIEKMDPTTARLLAKRMEELLAPLAAEFGLKVQVGGGKYDEGSYSPKATLSVVAKDGTVLDPAAVAFKQYAPLIGMQGSDLGREFNLNGRTFRISGYKPASRKMPVLGVDVATGRSYKFPEDAVRRALGIERPAPFSEGRVIMGGR